MPRYAIQAPELIHSSAGAVIAEAGLWERFCCPLTELAALEKDFGSDVTMAGLPDGLGWAPVWVRLRRISNHPRTGESRFVQRGSLLEAAHMADNARRDLHALRGRQERITSRQERIAKLRDSLVAKIAQLDALLLEKEVT